MAENTDNISARMWAVCMSLCIVTIYEKFPTLEQDKLVILKF